MVLHESSEAAQWEDMEYLIKLQGPDYLSCGGRPSRHKEFWSKFSLAMGMSARLSAANQHSKRQVSGRGFEAATRLLRWDSLKSNALVPRYDVFRVYYSYHDSRDVNLDSLQILLHFQQGQGQDALVRNEGQGFFITPLLELAANTVIDEQHHLNFSFFQMHYRCWDLHLKLQSELRQELTTAGRLTKENLLQQYQIAVGRVPATISQLSGIFSEEGKPPNGLVTRSYDVVNAFVKERGSQGVDAVRRAEEDSEVEYVGELEYEDSDEVEEIARGTGGPAQRAHAQAASSTAGASRPKTARHASPGGSSDPSDMELNMLMAILSASGSPMYPKKSYKDMLSMASKVDKKSLMPGMADILEVVQGAGRGENAAAAMRRMKEREDSYTPEEQAKILATTNLDDYMKVMKENRPDESTEQFEILTGRKKTPPPRSNNKKNKNKNKNRKLSNKAAKEMERQAEAGAEASEAEQPGVD